jgi:hypothetical protein
MIPSPHPRKQRAIRSGGPGSPSATQAIGVSEAPAFAAQGDVVPFVDCLSMPCRTTRSGVPGGRAATGGDADAAE